MKVLRFFEPLPEMILAGKKDTTWRYQDDKMLKEGDILSLVDRARHEFAKARVLWTRDTTFEHLRPEDTAGHEPFSSVEQMLEIYSGYYNVKVTLQTPIKVVKFALITT